MVRLWDPVGERLVYVGEPATAEFWDEHWSASGLDPATVLRRRDPMILGVTARHVPAGSRILESGCGRAQHVHALEREGYRCLGLDFAAGTLREVHRLAPELRLVCGDVFCLPLADESVDAVWSLGVIEHFWQGFAPILAEMHRVLRPGGHVFLTHPEVSPLRRLRVRAGRYQRLEGGQPEGFYQFALSAGRVREAAVAAGLVPRSRARYSGLKGLKDEVPALHGALQRLYDYRGRSLPVRGLRYLVDQAARPLAGHLALHVMQRPEPDQSR